MKLCKGGCGNNAKFKDWCVERYRECSGYKKKLSDKAKSRSNNGVRGILSKKYFIERPNEKEIFSLVCTICGSTYEKMLMRSTALYTKFIPICFDCSKKKQSTSISKTYSNKRKYKKYELLGPSYRKQICWDEQGQKCNHCGYDKYDLKTGPYDLHHKDGNKNNICKENEEVLCRNCHYMTNNHSFKGRHHTVETKKKISESHQNGRKKRKV